LQGRLDFSHGIVIVFEGERGMIDDFRLPAAIEQTLAAGAAGREPVRAL
jgi:hypothetical protein